MSNPAVGAKCVAALVVGVVGAGAFVGVSHDGRGGEAPADPEPIVEAPSSTTQPSAPTSPQVESTQPALPATPDPDPDPDATRARVRSRGS